MRMRLVAWSSVVLVVAVVVWSCASEKGGGHPARPDAKVTFPMYPVPAGFDYPQSAQVIEAWVKARDGHRIRAHGWNLWAALNAIGPNGKEIWRSWPTSTQTYSPKGLAAMSFDVAQDSLSIRERNRLNSPPNSPVNLPAPYYPVPGPVAKRWKIKNNDVPDGQTMQFNGDVMVAGVIYNEEAWSWIRETGTWKAETLTALQKSGRDSIDPMPAGSIVLKPMLWPVRKDGYTVLPMWDDLPPSADDGKYIGYEIQSKWKRAVAITPNPSPTAATVSATYLHGVYHHDRKTPLGPITYAQAKVVPITRFYHRRVDDLESLDPGDRAILDCAAWWCYGRPFESGDYLATIAMHVITREQPAWTLQTFWWYDEPSKSKYSKSQPDIPVSKAPGPWRHYLQTSTYGMVNKQKPSEWPVSYNPYIELAAAHPIATNCRNCHFRAAWPEVPNAWSRGNASSYQRDPAEYPHDPNALQVFTSKAALFDDLLRLDFQWAMGDRAYAPPGKK